jgi:S1-C subfamily serine protease
MRGAIHPNRAEEVSRFDPISPSGADAFLLAALERWERQVAAAMARARESVVVLEYTAADAPAGTRRIATGVVINQRGEMLSVKIDPLVSAKPAGIGKNSTPILARDYSGRRHFAHWIAADPETGLTLLQIVPRAVRPIRVATDRPNLGGQIFVLGNPFGMGQSVSRGHIAGLDWAMEVADRQLGGMIQVQAPLYPGDSGAAVVDVRGDLLGLIRSGLAIPCSRSAIRSRAGRGVGAGSPSFPAGQPVSWPAADAVTTRLDQAEQDNDFGFAISAGDALWVADQLRAFGRVDRAYLGVRLEGASDDLPISPLHPATPAERVLAERQNGLPTTALSLPSDQRPEPREGAMIVEVLAGTPAAESGLRTGDRIVSVDDRPIQSAHELTDQLDRIPARTTIQLGVIRGPGPRQERIVLSLRTASRPTQRQLAQLDRAVSQPAPAPSRTSTPTAPVTVTAASASSQPAATATTLAGHSAAARPASLSNPTLPENAPLVRRSASPAPELRPNDLRLTLPRAVLERLEQLERRLEKLEARSPGVKALSAKQDPQIGSVGNP